MRLDGCCRRRCTVWTDETSAASLRWCFCIQSFSPKVMLHRFLLLVRDASNPSVFILNPEPSPYKDSTAILFPLGQGDLLSCSRDTANADSFLQIFSFWGFDVFGNGWFLSASETASCTKFSHWMSRLEVLHGWQKHILAWAPMPSSHWPNSWTLSDKT